MAEQIFQMKEDFDASGEQNEDEPTDNADKKTVMGRLARSMFIRCKESSEDLASIVHLMLAVTLF